MLIFWNVLRFSFVKRKSRENKPWKIFRDSLDQFLQFLASVGKEVSRTSVKTQALEFDSVLAHSKCNLLVFSPKKFFLRPDLDNYRHQSGPKCLVTLENLCFSTLYQINANEMISNRNLVFRILRVTCKRQKEKLYFKREKCQKICKKLFY